MPALAPPRPAVQPPGRCASPLSNRHVLDNELTVSVHDLPGQHIASIVLDLGVDPRLEPAGFEGLATVMAKALTQGTGHHSRAEFAELVATVGMHTTVQATSTGPRLVATVPARMLPAALDLLAEAIAIPDLAPDPVRRQIRHAIAGIRQATSDPETCARRQLPA